MIVLFSRFYLLKSITGTGKGLSISNYNRGNKEKFLKCAENSGKGGLNGAREGS